MASIRKEAAVDAPAQIAWDALRDWGALHTRLVPGFATGLELDGQDRIVTFFNGAVMREVLIDCDDDLRRLAWTIVDGPYEHHSGYAQVFDDVERGCRFVWTTDLLPDEASASTAEMMQMGIEIIKTTLESQARVA